MERKSVCGEVNKISISKIQKYFPSGGFVSDSLVLSPLVNFRTLEGPPSAIDGITIGVVCTGTASVNTDTSDFLSSCMVFSIRSCFTVDSASGERLHRVLAMLSDAARSSASDVYGDKIISSLFTSFFYTLVSIIAANAEAMKNEGRRNRSDILLSEFFEALNEDCERERSVEYYAAKLGISPKYLSLICKNKTGRNASRLIDEAVIRKAKKLLMQTGMSIQEVSDRLNFVSQSFFGKYFKQRVGISPSRYKVGGAARK